MNSIETLRSVFLGAIFLLVGASAGAVGCGPNPKDFEHLRSPHIIQKPAQKFIVLELIGVPGKTAGVAFGKLYKAMYKIPDGDKGVDKQGPRARWPKPLETKPDEWVGIYAVPVSNSLTSLPDSVKEIDPGIRLETWEYGETLEMVHIGSYATEQPAVKALHEYAEAQGYKITGMHEEEYIRGPGMFMKGDENSYITFLRYTVAKKK